MESQRDEEEIAAHKKMSKSIIKILGPEGSLMGRQAVAQDAGSISADEFTFHYVNDSGIIFLALCHHRYPRVLAFAFLDELVNAFLAELTGAGAQNTRVSAVRRPYSFIRFEPTIQSIKKRYENTHRLRPNGDLADLSARVTNIPIYQVTDVLGPAVSITSGMHVSCVRGIIRCH
ncbi:SNAP receptor [Gaertneriomyces sp. JEL0708]|nr:SNAP receptor [Gaertneriomyces sp. JEL0708]